MRDRKNVNPRKKTGAGELFRKFGIGLLGGALGGALVLGGYTLLTDDSPATGIDSSLTSSSGSTTVSNVSVNVESDITSAVEKVQDAVVSVINMQSSSQSVSGLFGEVQQGEDDGELTEASEGSGVIYKIDGDIAYVVTNNHVIADNKALKVQLADGTSVDAELVGTDEYTDLAVLKISSKGVKATAEFGDSDNVKVGEPAIAIGSPLGAEYANSVTSGIVSSLNREVNIETDSGVATSYAIQTDAAINPGNSGGPLVNIEGQVIGINSSKIASTGASFMNDSVSIEGMGFAIPSNQVVKIINELVKNGEVVRPALGVQMVDFTNITSAQRDKYFPDLPEDITTGAIIGSVSKGTPAEEAGLEAYDVVVALDDDEVTSSSDLKSFLYKKNVGDTIKLTYYRGKEKKTVEVKLTMEASELENSSSNNQNNNDEEDGYDNDQRIIPGN